MQTRFFSEYESEYAVSTTDYVNMTCDEYEAYPHKDIVCDDIYGGNHVRAYSPSLQTLFSAQVTFNG